MRRERRAKQHLIDNGSTTAIYIADKDRLLRSYEALLREHHKQAQAEKKEYKDRFSSASTPEDLGDGMLQAPEVVLAIDFQMGKLVPHWGRSAHPGKTYYYQKIMHHLFGVVDATNKQSFVYVMDETVAGDKNSDDVCSYSWIYVQKLPRPHPPLLRIYLDSASYFKTCTLIY